MNATHTTTYTILSHRTLDALQAIERANRRLRRAGIGDGFTYTTRTRTVTEDGRYISVTDLALSAPQIALGEYRITGKHERTAGGAVLSHWAVGTEGIDAPTTTDCDHCGVNRRRKTVYTLTGVDGERYQIGGTCLELYTGVQPGGLWALAFEIPEDLSYEEGGGARNAGSEVFEGYTLLAITSRILTTRAWVSRSRAGMGYTATADHVRDMLDAGGIDDITADERAEAEAVAAWTQSFEDASEYESKLTAVYTPDEDGQLMVEPGHLALFISALPSYRGFLERERREEEKKAADALVVEEYLAPVGTNLKGMGVEATVLRSVYGHQQGHYAAPLHTTLRDDAGHILYWRGSAAASLDMPDSGGRIRIDGGTVKGTHVSDYSGHHETVLTRVKFTVL